MFYKYWKYLFNVKTSYSVFCTILMDLVVLFSDGYSVFLVSVLSGCCKCHDICFNLLDLVYKFSFYGQTQTLPHVTPHVTASNVNKP